MLLKIERVGLGQSLYVRPWTLPTVCTIAGARHLSEIIIAVVAATLRCGFGHVVQWEGGGIWARCLHRRRQFLLDIRGGDSTN